MFGRLAFLDNKVSRCYGCGEALKPGGRIPHPPDDLVVTTRLNRQYYNQDGQLQTSPRISSVYFHLNPQCVRAACPLFAVTSCQIPNDLIGFFPVFTASERIAGTLWYRLCQLVNGLILTMLRHPLSL
jgi:hypothetical protein